LLSSTPAGVIIQILESGEEAFAIGGRGRRVLVYTAALLLAPLPAMPFAPGTREFAWAVGACGAALAAASYYVARGEWRLRHRGPLGNRLLAASLITLLFGMALAAGAVVYLGGV
jgi:hypothetical protein